MAIETSAGSTQSEKSHSLDLAIETRGLTKRFGDLLAVDNLDLAVPRGMFYGLLGPNGAGKSTTVAMLTGLARPGAGLIRLLDRTLAEGDVWYKSLIGVVTEEPPLFERLRGQEQLVFTARMYGLDRSQADARTRDLLRLLQLESRADAFVADYSRGMQKKLAIACALIHAPRILFFDEPFEGVDASSAETIRQVLSGLTRAGATVLLTTHILEVAQKLCRRVGILHRGRLVHEEDTAAMRARGADLAEVFHAAIGASGAPADLPAWLVGEAG